MKELRDLKDSMIHDVQPISDEHCRSGESLSSRQRSSTLFETRALQVGLCIASFTLRERLTPSHFERCRQPRTLHSGLSAKLLIFNIQPRSLKPET